MDKHLRDLIQINGVIGAMILTNTGEILAHLGDFKLLPLKSVATEISGLYREQILLDKQIKWFLISFDIFNVQFSIHHPILIVCFSDSDVPTSLIRLTLGVVLSKLKNDKKFQKSINNL